MPPCATAVLEEAYEVVDAIDADDRAGLAEELGDLLLLIVACTRRSPRKQGSSRSRTSTRASTAS